MSRKTLRQSARDRLSKEEMSAALRGILSRSDVIDSDDTAVMFYDLNLLADKLSELNRLFPETTLHAIAMKANPLRAVLAMTAQRGYGIEVASLPELYMAERSGFAAAKIVYDSPAKTRDEIRYALKSGVYLNADSFEELNRIDDILKEKDPTSTIGLRINPQVGTGSIKSTSVASSISKFGIPLAGNRERIVDCFRRYAWLTGLHVHVGSQGCPVPMMIRAIEVVLNLASEINSLRSDEAKTRVCTIDIGGGLPVSYRNSARAVTMEQYRNELKSNFPGLFDGSCRLVTEFGRYVHANAGWIASRVEYVKRERTYNIAMTHVGADMLLRECYNPKDWHHEISVVDKEGRLKTGVDKNRYLIAGPLCFAGDIIARDIELPYVEEGDYLLIHDAGAYTLSMWSRYNSRQVPKVIGYSHDSPVRVLKARETPEQLLSFWS